MIDWKGKARVAKAGPCAASLQGLAHSGCVGDTNALRNRRQRRGRACDPALVRTDEGAGCEALGGIIATKSPFYPSDPFTSGIFASAVVAADPAVLGAYFRCRLFGLVVEVGGSGAMI